MPRIKKIEYIDKDRILADAIQEQHAQGFIPRQWSIVQCNEDTNRTPLGYTTTLVLEGELRKLDGSREDCRIALVMPDEALREIASELINSST